MNVLFRLTLVGMLAAALFPVKSPVMATDLPAGAPQEMIYMERAGSWPYGPAEAVAVDEARDLVYLSSGGAVLVLDVTDPTSPALVSDAVEGLGLVEDLFYDPGNQRLYLASGEGGFEIWDLSNPSNPNRLSAIEVYYFGVETPVEGVVVVGDFAYVSANWGYVHWIDVSDPENPVDMGFNGVGGNPSLGIHADGNYVFTCGASFQRFIIQPDGSLSSAGHHDFTYCAFPYASGTYGYADQGSDLYIMDLTLPFFQIVGIYPAGGVRDLVIVGNTGYLVNSSGLQVLDMSYPPNPVLLGYYATPGSSRGVMLSGQLAYVADYSAGLQVVDVSDPANPTGIGNYDTPGVAWKTHVVGAHAYLANADALMILDIGDVTQPELIGDVPSNGETRDVDVEGSLAVVADWTGGLRILDVSDPADPVEVGGVDTFDAWRVDVQGDWAYAIEAVANQPYSLHVLDVSDPANPVETGSLSLPAFVWKIEARGDYLYVANYEYGFRVIDVSDPSDPQIVATYPAPDVFDFAIQGDIAYLAATDWDGGLVILDISDPTNPALITIYNPSGWFHPSQVAVSGDYVYMGDPTEDFYLFDVSDPANPQELEEFKMAGDFFQVTAAGGYVFVSDGTAGMPILRNTLYSPYEASLGPDTEREVLPGTVAVHDFLLTNVGITDTYTLTLSDYTWPTTLLTGSPVSLGGGEALTVTVEVAAPPLDVRTVHGTDAFTLTVQSHGDPALFRSATGTTRSVTHPGVSLDPATQERVGAPGESVSHTMTLTNTGDYTDTYQLAISGESWPTGGPGLAGPLGPGEATGFVITVSLPTAPGSNSDTFTLTVTSDLDPAIGAQASGTSRVDADPALDLSADHVGEGDPGTVVSYTLAVTNTGAYSDTFILNASGQWTVTLVNGQVGPLGPEDVAAFSVAVAIPVDVPSGTADLTTITAASSWDPAVTAQVYITTVATQPFTGWEQYIPLVIR